MQKTAIITGGAARVGMEMAKHLAAQGWNIAIHYNTSRQPAEQLVNTLSSAYPALHFDLFKADLSLDSEAEELVSIVAGKMGGLSLLINNASLFEPGSIGATSADFLEKMWVVNFKAPYVLSRNFAQFCSLGNIVNMVDTRITANKPDHAAYTLSKKALWELTKMAAIEWAPGIRVNAIAPGLTLPPANEDDDYLWKLAQGIPMLRPGGIEPILKSLDYILGNDYLTGQLLYCDGGQNII